MATGAEEFHGVVIVGGGICGLATALALHIKGINSLVLEKAESLRATGAGISIQANGWRALDQMKVGEELRKMAMPLTGMDKRDILDGRTIGVSYRTEAWCLKRSDLIETLAGNLRAGSIRFGCQIEAISLDTVSQCPIISTSDGTSIRAKVVIGCDGSNSVVAKYLGLKALSFLPMWAARGFTIYPEGHGFGNRFLQLIGKGINFRLVPIDDKAVHFSAIQSQPPKECTSSRDPGVIRQGALQAMQGFPEDVLDVVRRCDITSLSLTQLCYRAPWHMILEPFQEGTVTVAGDAMHAMGPFLGQGGSCGLEDAVVLARCLAGMVPNGVIAAADSDGKLHKRVKEALVSYVKERRWRILRLSMQTFVTGELIAASSELKKLLIRFAMAALYRGNSYSHTAFDCGTL